MVERRDFLYPALTTVQLEKVDPFSIIFLDFSYLQNRNSST